MTMTISTTMAIWIGNNDNNDNKNNDYTDDDHKTTMVARGDNNDTSNEVWDNIKKWPRYTVLFFSIFFFSKNVF